MKKYLSLVLSLVFAVILIGGCGEGKKTVEIKSLQDYQDPILYFSLKFPSNWETQKSPGDRFIAITNKLAMKRFRAYDPEGEACAKIEVQVIKLSGDVTIDSIIDKKLFTTETYTKPKEVMLDGVKAIMQSYTFPLNDGIFQGEVYYAQKDADVVTIVSFEAFAGTFDFYKDKFNEILKTVQLGRMPTQKSDTVKKVVEAPPPSLTLVNYKGEGFTIQISDNLDVKNPKAGGVIKSYQFIGERRADCEIRIDIIDASKQKSVEKIAEQNKSAHGNGNASATNLGGEKAMVFNYSPVSGVMSKAYYVVKGTRCYRITMNWFKGEEQQFKPIFEKSINSIKFQ